MEHFAIIQALCRAAMANPSDALRRQVERLRDELTKAGEAKEARALSAILSSASRSADLLPSRLTRSSQAVSDLAGESLTRQVSLPVDRETAVPLAQVIFPEDMPDAAPVLESDLAAAVSGILREWSQAEALKKYEITPAMTCLLYGAPGTGKTRLALWMAKQLGVPAVVGQLDGLISSFLGTTARNIGALFAFAARYRCVLLLDEFDAIAKIRDDPQEVGEIKRVVNALLQNLDSRKQFGYTIGITNHEHLLDSAVWRRFDIQVQIPKPSFESRLEIARAYIRPVELDEGQFRMIAWLCDGASGADIESLATFIKKDRALNPDFDLFATLRQFAAVNSGRLSSERKSVLFMDPQEMAKTLLADGELRFDQSDVAGLIGRNKATISRWMKHA